MFPTKHCFSILGIFIICLTQLCKALDVFDSDTNDQNLQSNIPEDEPTLEVHNVPYTGEHEPTFVLKGQVRDYQHSILGSPSELWPNRKRFSAINEIWPERDINVKDIIQRTARAQEQEQEDMAGIQHNAYQKKNEQNVRNTASQFARSTSASQIEFYYMDEDYDFWPEKQPSVKSLEDKKKSDFQENPSFPQSLIFEQRSKRDQLPLVETFHTNNIVSSSNTATTQLPKTPPINYSTHISRKNKKPRVIKLIPYLQSISPKCKPQPTTEKTTSDRVKFFEIYDKQTTVPNNQTAKNQVQQEVFDKNSIEKEAVKQKESEKQDYETITPKEIIKEDDETTTTTKVFKDVPSKFTFKYSSTTKIPIFMRKSSSDSLKKAKRSRNQFTDITTSELNEVTWSTYPYAAAYIYEKLRIHCDAAAISPYWLMSSAACLWRQKDDTKDEKGSAFVAYCGVDWVNPECITYVKYTRVHPEYNVNDTERKYMFNIGVIRVTNSMSSSCPNWAPVTLMTVQMNDTESKKTSAVALGWGLNRYDPTYATEDLPKHKLTVYKSYMYSNSCPGSSNYKTIKQDCEEVASNVYCLSLPPYTEEDLDPIHGGLLLVDRKLIGLYLLEERRRSGSQSAMYTGVWSHIDWVRAVATEPHEMNFSLL